MDKGGGLALERKSAIVSRLMVQILDIASSEDGYRDKVSHIPVLGLTPELTVSLLR
jgi:hypothetical protein